MIKIIRREVINGIEYVDFAEYSSPNDAWSGGGGPGTGGGGIASDVDTSEFGGGGTDPTTLTPTLAERPIINVSPSGKILAKLQMFDTPGVGYHPNITPVISNGKHLTGPGSSALLYDFIVGTVPGGRELAYMNSVKNKNYPDDIYWEYDKKYGIPVNFEKTTNGVIKNHWINRDRIDGKGKYRNYINWSMFERRNTNWGSGQPTGIFVKDGIYYGAKPMIGEYWMSALAKVNGKWDIYYADELFQSRNPAKLIPNISIAAGGAYMIIKNNKALNSSHGASNWPFFGKATLKDGKEKFFAGVTLEAATPTGLGNTIINHFRTMGATVNRCGVGDGGGSTTLVVDGKWENPKAEGRANSTIIYW